MVKDTLISLTAAEFCHKSKEICTDGDAGET